MKQVTCPHDGKQCTAADREMCGIGCTYGPVEHITESDDREERKNWNINEAAIAHDLFSGSSKFDYEEEEENKENYDERCFP